MKDSMKLLLITLLSLFALAAEAQTTEQPITKEKWHWDRAPKQDTAIGYAQIVKVDNVLYISGIVARELTPAGMTRLYRELEKTLSKFGAGFQHVVKENLYTTDIEAVKELNPIRKTFYKGDYPAATWVQITRLFTGDAKLEVELIAHLPK